MEGSGEGGGEVRDDLEASGSGLGPDDEDGDGASGNYFYRFILDILTHVINLLKNFPEFNPKSSHEPSNKPSEPNILEETIYKTKQV